MIHLSWLLMWFKALSGFEINLDKSELIPIGGIIDVDILLALELGCKVGKISSTHVGLPLGAPCRYKTVWGYVEEKFCKRLSL